MKNFMKKNKGITLIALVVTIIVLLILAGVTIALLTGDNGILTQARETVNKSDISEYQEDIQLADTESKISEGGKRNFTKLEEILNKTGKYDVITSNESMTIITKTERYVFELNDKLTYQGVQIITSEAEPIMMDRDDSYAFWKEEYRAKITSIKLENFIVRKSNVIKEWDVSKYKNKSVIASITDNGNGGYNLYIAGNGIIKITDCSRLFEGFTIVENIDIKNIDTKDVGLMWYMFENCEELKELDISSLNTQNVQSMNGMFMNCKKLEKVEGLNLNSTMNSRISSMFSGCTSLKYTAFSNLNTENVTHMDYMFMNCNSLKDLNLKNFNTKNVSSMEAMFRGCTNLKNINLNSFNTENVENMSYMFTDCKSLEEIDLSNFNTKNVKNMKNMFQNCMEITNINLSSFDTTNVADIQIMFYECKKLRILNIRGFSIKDGTVYDFMLDGVPASVQIITNMEMKNWLNDKFSNYQNISVVN